MDGWMDVFKHCGTVQRRQTPQFCAIAAFRVSETVTTYRPTAFWNQIPELIILKTSPNQGFHMIVTEQVVALWHLTMKNTSSVTKLL